MLLAMTQCVFERTRSVVLIAYNKMRELCSEVRGQLKSRYKSTGFMSRDWQLKSHAALLGVYFNSLEMSIRKGC